MTSLLEHLGKDTLPKPVLDAFVDWCIWQQARPALLQVLEKTKLVGPADDVRAASDLPALATSSERARNEAHEARKTTGPLGMSAAEAAAFEVTNLVTAASEEEWDPESVSFFAARVCGWAGWAQTDFKDPEQKSKAEITARNEQDAQLQTLWKKHGLSQE